MHDGPFFPGARGGRKLRRIKIVGAGSIGNHLAGAARRMGWAVVVSDIDPDALERMRTEIYPARFGAWDEEIGLFPSQEAPTGQFDAIFIGTPPDSHLPLAMDALDESPQVLIIEKPLCPPTLDLLDEFSTRSRTSPTKVLVGYNHVVGRATRRVDGLLAGRIIGEIQTIDVAFREHWGGIFNAHPWLSGPADSYLGSWRSGGGAGGEHSHGLNLWQHFATKAEAGRISEVTASVEYIDCGDSAYDSMWSVNVRTENGLMGRVVQDVVTTPPKKMAMIQGSEGRLTWICGHMGTNDAVVLELEHTDPDVEIIEKTRADDFLEELRVVDDVLAGDDSGESLSLARASETALIIHAAHRSEEARARMRIDYDRGYTPGAVVAMEARR